MMASSDASLVQFMNQGDLGKPWYRKKNQKLGINFSLMVVGASGLGKSTFLSALCGANNKIFQNPVESAETICEEKTTCITSNTIEVNDGKFAIELTLIDTPGFGDNIDNEKNFDEVLRYIEQRYDEIMIEESRIRRNPKIQDHRIHALIYFISPTGHSLKEIDIRFMSLVARRINVIPVIAKADSLTPEELLEFKCRINEDITKHKIPVYDMPISENDCEDDALIENSELKSLRPFAIVASRKVKELEDGSVIRCREYPWGYINIDDETQCDFSKLRTMLFRTDLYTLREITHNVLYEQYRTERLSAQDPNMIFAMSQTGSSLTDASNQEYVASQNNAMSQSMAMSNESN